jgi:hypothetical protein
MKELFFTQCSKRSFAIQKHIFLICTYLVSVS